VSERPTELLERSMRMVGGIQAVSDAAKALQCMPCDKRTAELLDLARATLNKAMLACWEYAEIECVPETGETP
jgi:hypothetical protein